METTIKYNVKALKAVIENLVKEQKSLKNQRKTVNLKGKRTIEPWVAAYKHAANRETLRVLYAAYGLMRGKTFEQTENNHKGTVHPLNEFKSKIDKIILDYIIEESIII